MKLYKDFVCESEFNNSGESIKKTCVNIETEGGDAIPPMYMRHGKHSRRVNEDGKNYCGSFSRGLAVMLMQLHRIFRTGFSQYRTTIRQKNKPDGGCA